MDTKIQRYFNSTPLRNVFARLMADAYYKKEPKTITQLAAKIDATRQAISILVKECEAEKFIKVIRKNGKVQCIGSEILIEAFEDYCRWKKFLFLKNQYYMLNQIGNVDDIINKL